MKLARVCPRVITCCPWFPTLELGQETFQMMIPHTPTPHTGIRCNKDYPHSHPWSRSDFRALLPPPRPKGWSVNPKVGPDFRLPVPRSPSSVASPKRGDRKEKNQRRRETRRRVAVAKAKAKDRERPQITVATVIQKPGEDVKKKGVIERCGGIIIWNAEHRRS